ncbi:MAG: phasin family protein [Parvularculaceae bacterium]
MAAAKKTTAKAAKTAKITPEKFTEGFEKVTKSFEEANTISKENLDAVVEASTTFAKGVEEIVAEQTDFVKGALEEVTEKAQAFSTTRNPQDFFEAQSAFLKSAYETNLAQMTKVTEMFTATAKDAADPLSKRYTAMVEKVQGYSL